MLLLNLKYNIIRMNKEIKIGYKISKIHTIGFAIKDIKEEELEPLFNDSLATINVGSNINFDAKVSSIVIDIKSSLAKKGGKNDLVSHTGRTVFFIRDLDSYFNSEDGSYNLPQNFLLQLLGISFSHSRALLATELQSTVYRDKFILPVIDPSLLLPNQKEHI